MQKLELCFISDLNTHPYFYLDIPPSSGLHARMKIFLFLAFVTAAILPARAVEPTAAKTGEWKADTLDIEGKTYRSATVTLRDPSTARIIHSEGIASANPADLPVAAQQSIGYDPAAATAHTTRRAAQQNAKTNAPAVRTIRYKVNENRRDGLVVAIYEQRESSFVVPGASSRTGGGGGVSGKTMEWEDTGKEAWITHTKATQNLTNDSYFTAKVTITGETERIWDNMLVARHNLVEILADKPKK
jgi:hypothetical protein